MGLEEQTGQFQSVLGRVFFTDTVIVTAVKVGLVICGFELSELNESS